MTPRPAPPGEPQSHSLWAARQPTQTPTPAPALAAGPVLRGFAHDCRVSLKLGFPHSALFMSDSGSLWPPAPCRPSAPFPSDRILLFQASGRGLFPTVKKTISRVFKGPSPWAESPPVLFGQGLSSVGDTLSVRVHPSQFKLRSPRTLCPEELSEAPAGLLPRVALRSRVGVVSGWSTSSSTSEPLGAKCFPVPGSLRHGPHAGLWAAAQTGPCPWGRPVGPVPGTACRSSQPPQGPKGWMPVSISSLPAWAPPALGHLSSLPAAEMVSWPGPTRHTRGL